ncbi:MAG: gamma-glutamyl-gamma-aminobutyrate hydrolase family protein [Planctomycetota bacterium]|jgi:putative glutamine amidotransferase
MAPLRVGLSCSLLPPTPGRALFKGKTLCYVERGMPDWVAREGAVPLMLAAPGFEGADIAAWASASLGAIDALVLTGGTDVAPTSYGEEPLRPEWAGQAERDAFEIALLRGAIDRGLPVLGVCRGIQLLNVALGGTLFQDLPTQHGEDVAHRDGEIYDKNEHEIVFEGSGWLTGLYQGAPGGTVMSVHHQAIRDLAKGLTVEARCPLDDVIEAVRLEGPGYVRGVQWHPEFQRPEQTHLLCAQVLLQDVLEHAVAVSSDSSRPT